MTAVSGPQSGYLLIADISGYTAFLAQSELEHGQDIMRGLFESLLAEIRSPLIVSELEGDAIFMYAPEGSFVNDRTLLDVIETLYVAFASARDIMDHNTSCTCTACRLIPTLDLKFVAHYGTFITQQLERRDRPKPSGPDVILVHRLLKNQIKEKTGIHAYAFFSGQCVDALNLGDFVDRMQPHAETYEHLGETRGFVYDLHPYWADRKHRHRIAVEPDQVWFEVDGEVPATPAVVWDYLNDPEYKRQLREADAIRVIQSNDGRTGLGSEHHCVHGRSVIAEQIVDWRPFDYFTLEGKWPFGVTALCTNQLEPTDNGTRVRFLVSRPRGRNAVHSLAADLVYALLKKRLVSGFSRSLTILRSLSEERTRPEAISTTVTAQLVG